MSYMLEHNEKWQNIIRSFCVPENVRTVIKRESYGPDPFKKLKTVKKLLFIEKEVNMNHNFHWKKGHTELCYWRELELKH